MRHRFWLAVARFAAKRADGYVLRPYTTDADWGAAYVKWTQPTSTVTTTMQGTNITYRP